MRDHCLLGQLKSCFEMLHRSRGPNYRKVPWWIVLTLDTTCDQTSPLCLPKLPHNRGSCFLEVRAEFVIFCPWCVIVWERVTIEAFHAFSLQITAKAAIVFVALQYNVTRPATGRYSCWCASGQIWKCPWTLKSMLISSVWALFYPKQCMKPSFMCLLFIIYLVHGLEIPSEFSVSLPTVPY